jgi:FkbM family methyltransferase
MAETTILIENADAAWRRFTTGWRFKVEESLYRHVFPVYRAITAFCRRYLVDRHVVRLMRSHLQRGSLAIDIGANIGFFTREFAKCGAEVLAFEPDSANFERLRSVEKAFEKVVLHQAAVSNRTGFVNFFISNDLSTDHRIYDDGSGRARVDVPVTTVDVVVDRPVRLIKMDIQGSEHQALRGMRETIARSPQLAICSELWPYGLRKAGTSASDFLAELDALGFETFTIDDRTGDLEKIASTNWNNLEESPSVYISIWSIKR